MNVLMMLETDFPPDIRVENEIGQLLKLNYNVTIACYTFSDRKLNDIYKGCKVIRKRISNFTYKTSVGALKFPFYFNFWRSFMSDILSKESYDILHVHDLPLTKVGIEIKNKYNIPLIIDLHENWPALIADAPHTQTLLGKLLSSNKQWEDYERNQLKSADGIITVVQEMKNRIASKGILKSKIEVVENVLDIDAFPHNNIEPYKGLSLFYGGGLNFHRGLQVAIRGMAIIKDKIPNIKLYIAGDGSYRSELEKLVVSLGLQDNVIFFGKMSQHDLLIEMMKSSVVLIPHLKSVQTDNSSPNKLYQYMYAKKPILSSDCNSLKRVIEDSNVGLVYKDDDPASFAENLNTLILKNKDNVFGENGYKAVVNKYNWDNQRNVLRDIYERQIN